MRSDHAQMRAVRLGKVPKPARTFLLMCLYACVLLLLSQTLFTTMKAIVPTTMTAAAR